MIQVAPGQQVKPMISPRGGPVGGEVTLTVVGTDPLSTLRIGFGSFEQYELIAREQTDADGTFSKNFPVPYWAQRDRVHFFFIMFGNQQPRALSDPFQVTAPDGTTRIVGTIAAGSGGCTALDGPDDTRYALEGPLGGWDPGMRVVVVGTVAGEAPCDGGAVPISVREIQLA